MTRKAQTSCAGSQSWSWWCWWWWWWRWECRMKKCGVAGNDENNEEDEGYCTRKRPENCMQQPCLHQLVAESCINRPLAKTATFLEWPKSEESLHNRKKSRLCRPLPGQGKLWPQNSSYQPQNDSFQADSEILTAPCMILITQNKLFTSRPRVTDSVLFMVVDGCSWNEVDGIALWMIELCLYKQRFTNHQHPSSSTKDQGCLFDGWV